MAIICHRIGKCGLSFTAVLLASAVATPAMAERRTEISPYLEVDQLMFADLKGGNGDVLTYTTVAAGVDANIRTRNAELQANVRYERRFAWNDDLADEDVISGLVNGRYNVVRDILSIEGGAIATRARTDGLGGANGVLGGNVGQTSEIYSFYAGPTLTTNVGALSVNAAYRLGYTKVTSDSGVVLPNGSPVLNQYDGSTFHSASASVGMQPGDMPFGWSVGAGYNREDTSQLDQRYEDKFLRADVTVPVGHSLALVGGVGYEDIKISQRDALRDGLGNPVLDGSGRFQTDPASPRLLSYDQDGLIWDAGVLWRPSRRTSVEARVGRRYGSMTYIGSASWQPSSNTSVSIGLFDGVDSFGRQINNGISSLPSSFNVTRNPFSGDLANCTFGSNGQAGGLCLNDTLSAITTANYRNRGISGQFTQVAGPWSYGLGAGYSQRKFIAPNSALFASVNGVTDENYYASLFVSRKLDEKSGIDANIYANYYDTELAGSLDVMNAGAYASYYRNFTRRLQATAAVGVDQINPKGLDETITGIAQLGLRYQF